MNWLDGVFALILVLSSLDGLRKGFISTVFGLAGTIASICAAAYYHPKVADYLNLNFNLLAKIQELIGDKVNIPVESAGLGLANTTIESLERVMLQLNLPAPVREAVLKNSSGLGEAAVRSTETLGQYLVMALSRFALSAISFVLVLCAVRLVFIIISFLLNLLVDSGFMSLSNRLMGLGAGLIQGVLISMLVITFIVPIIPGGAAVSESGLAGLIARFNFIPALISVAFK